MDIKYAPPLQDKDECNWLRKNFIACLKEKVVKDDVQKMTCNVENILWYNLECPQSYKQFKNPSLLRQTFLEEKGVSSGKSNYVKI